MQIAITTSSFGVFDGTPLLRLKDEGVKYVLNPFRRKLTPAELMDIAADADGIIAGTETINLDVLKKLPRLKVVSRCGVGMDNVDLEGAKRLGVKVFNTPDGPTLSVAELTVGLILNLMRRISTTHGKLKNGIWEKQMGNLLSNKKIGILGFGRIGQKVAELTIPFSVEVAYCDICSMSSPYESKSMSEMLSWADIVTLHCSVAPNKKPLIGEQELKQMKPGAWLINTSRGGLVDERALYHSLQEGRLSGAALDVFEHEPYQGRLCELDNVILTPHIGSYAMEGRVKMEKQSVSNLIKGLKMI